MKVPAESKPWSAKFVGDLLSYLVDRLGAITIDHSCIGHSCIDHNSIGHNYIGHNYIGRDVQSYDFFDGLNAFGD